MSRDKFRIIAKIGQGYDGIVYKVRYEGDDDKFGGIYAMKTQRIMPSKLKIKPNIIDAEAAFGEFAQKHKDYFAQLVFKPLLLNQPASSEEMEHAPNQRLFKLMQSPWVYIRFYNLFDSPYLDHIVSSLDNNIDDIAISSYIQIVYAIYLMNDAGFRHGDLHQSNLMVRYTEPGVTLKIFDLTVPTFGSQISIIDYADSYKIDDPRYVEEINQIPNELVRYIFRVVAYNCIDCLHSRNQPTPNLDETASRLQEQMPDAYKGIPMDKLKPKFRILISYIYAAMHDYNRYWAIVCGGEIPKKFQLERSFGLSFRALEVLVENMYNLRKCIEELYNLIKL